MRDRLVCKVGHEGIVSQLRRTSPLTPLLDWDKSFKKLKETLGITRSRIPDQNSTTIPLRAETIETRIQIKVLCHVTVVVDLIQLQRVNLKICSVIFVRRATLLKFVGQSRVLFTKHQVLKRTFICTIGQKKNTNYSH